jgi:hypothetical protein
MADSCWFETIPAEEFDDNKNLLMTQLRATKWSRNMQFYRKTHSPLDVTHLSEFLYDDNKLVWWDEESFLMTRFPSDSQVKVSKWDYNNSFYKSK